MARPSIIEDRLINDRELCDLLGWNPSTPSVLRARGKMQIPFIKIGKRVRYRVSDVEAYLEKQTVNQGECKAGGQGED